jgi:lipopolysaccharide transport system ATP-binding protein
MSDVAIRVEGLGKQYRIGGPKEPYRTLREQLRRVMAAPLRALRRSRGEGADPLFWALRDVSFDVKRGEAVGIIGRNGAGKSTLLKILSQITTPTEGEVDLHGRVGSLLEVGTGFHQELTGRENVYLNGAILGMTRAEITRKFDEIVAFAEVERFIDTPVKHYSSGMYMRLAFAVAANMGQEILIVDEVLAVGDGEFQKKCLGKMNDVTSTGRTVLFVSHNMGAVQKLCHRGVVLEAGTVRFVGTPADAIQQYLASALRADGRLNPAGRRFIPHKVEIVDAWIETDGAPAGALMSGDPADVYLRLAVRQAGRFSIELILRQQDGLPVAFAPSGLSQGWEIDGKVGEITIRCKLPRLSYAAGRYSIDLIAAVTGSQFLDYVESGLCFDLEGTPIGERNWTFSQSRGQGYALWDVTFAVIPTDGERHVAS